MQLKINQGSNQQHQFVQDSKEIDSFHSKQLFSIFYDDIVFIVDLISLSNASLRFKEMIKPFVHQNDFIKTHHLEIHCNEFTKRNMNNFLNICQNLPNDIQDSEMKEICEIAKMFKANEIYETGLSFVQNHIDPNFTIPDYKYDSNENLMSIEKDKIDILQDSNKKKIFSEDTLINSILTNISNNAKNNENYENNASFIDQYFIKNGLKETKKKNSVIYRVQIEKRAFKTPIYKCFLDNQMLYSAAQKRNEIFIKDSNYNNKSKNYIGHIIQKEANRSNRIKIRDIAFNLNYISSADPNHYQIDVSFPANNKVVSWFPKPPKYDMGNENYYRNFHGEYHRRAVRSPKNIALQNDAGHPAFIVRKMGKNLYEFECNHNVDPLIAFSVGLSSVVGPYKDPWSTINGKFY